MGRNPYWGRNYEIWGEDPHLAGRMTVAYINGFRGDHPEYLKIAPTAKHFAVNNVDQIAVEIMKLGDELVNRVSAESGLGTGRIESERGQGNLRHGPESGRADSGLRRDGQYQSSVSAGKKLSKSAKNLAEEYAGSVSLEVGQFCTNPGLLIAKESKDLEDFKKILSEKLKEKTRGSATVASTSAGNFLSNEVFHEEVFGPYTLVISCRNNEQMQEVAAKLEGQLTITLIGDEEELVDNRPKFNLLCYTYWFEPRIYVTDMLEDTE